MSLLHDKITRSLANYNPKIRQKKKMKGEETSYEYKARIEHHYNKTSEYILYVPCMTPKDQLDTRTNTK